MAVVEQGRLERRAGVGDLVESMAWGPPWETAPRWSGGLPGGSPRQGLQLLRKLSQGLATQRTPTAFSANPIQLPRRTHMPTYVHTRSRIRSAGYPEMESLSYLASSGLCIGALACLSNQKSARLGNTLGLMGVGTGLAASLGGLTGADPATYVQLLGAPAVLLRCACCVLRCVPVLCCAVVRCAALGRGCPWAGRRQAGLLACSPAHKPLLHPDPPRWPQARWASAAASARLWRARWPSLTSPRWWQPSTRW